MKRLWHCVCHITLHKLCSLQGACTQPADKHSMHHMAWYNTARSSTRRQQCHTLCGITSCLPYLPSALPPFLTGLRPRLLLRLLLRLAGTSLSLGRP